MKKGFTILELLVASLLLGMLMTILTMVFNQSSIAWRTGVAGVADLDDIRDEIADIRAEADSIYLWDTDVHRVLSPWDKDGNLRKRAIDVNGVSVQNSEKVTRLAGAVSLQRNPERVTVTQPYGLSSSVESSGRLVNYTVNVKSNGPNREPDDYDDIWSFPDEFE